MAAREGEPTFQEILQFDPFEEGSDSSAEGGGETPESGEEKPAGGEPPPPQEAPVEGGAPPPSVGEPPKPVSQADLESLIRQQTETIRAAVQRPPEPARPAVAAPKFNLGVPEALTTALRSEDPAQFQAGVGALINGVANHVWNAFSEHLEKNVLPAMPRIVEGFIESARRQEAVATDFYGTYPQLRIPEMAPVIQAIGAQVAQEWYQQGRDLSWSQGLRDEIANRLFQRMPFLRNLQQPQPTQQRRRPFAAGSGTRPAAEPDSPQRDMMEMIFGPPQ